jgi:serine/threonine-protein kinase
MSGPVDPQADSARSRFLLALLEDEERGGALGLDDYLARFPEIANFVREEYAVMLDRNERDAAFRARYELQQVLGQGGMGEVTLALDKVLGRKVALKSVRGSACDARTLERLRREARVLSRLDHPAICRILDVVERDGAVTLVLPFHAGTSLAEWIDRARARQPMPTFMPLDASDDGADPTRSLSALLAYFVHVVDAVHAAHVSGVIHRDLKPANLLVLPTGMPMVLDFGLALDLQDGSSRLTMAGESIGTSYYMSPEQIEGRTASVSNDVYALGLTLYEMLTLERPYAGDTRAATFRQVLGGAISAPRQRNPLIPSALESIVLRACARDPERRFANARELAAQLRTVMRGLRSGFELGDSSWLGRPVAAGAAAMLVLLGATTATVFQGATTRAEARSSAVAALCAEVPSQVVGVEQDLLSVRQRSKDATPRVDEPRGTVLEPPTMVRLSGGKPGSHWRLMVRSPDLASPVVASWAPGSVAVELPRVAWQPGVCYRIYLAPVAEDGSVERDALLEPASEFTFAPDEAPSSSPVAALAKALQLHESGASNSALMILDGLRSDSFADDRLALLWSALRVRSLVGAGYSGAPLEHAAKDLATRQRVARMGRARELLLGLADLEPCSRAAAERLAEIEAAVPLSSAPGPWVWMAVARYYLDAVGRPSLAIEQLDPVLDVLRPLQSLDELDRQSMLQHADLLAITQPTRPQAATIADAMAHALLLRARAQTQAGLGAAASDSLRQAEPWIAQVDSGILRVLALVQSAEVRILLGDRLWDEPLRSAEQLCRSQAELTPDPAWNTCSAAAAGVAARLHLVCGQFDLAESGYRQVLARSVGMSDAAGAWCGIGASQVRLVTLRLATSLFWQVSPDKRGEAQQLLLAQQRAAVRDPSPSPAVAARLQMLKAIVRLRRGLDATQRAALMTELQATLDDPLLREAAMEQEELRDIWQRIGAGEKF